MHLPMCLPTHQKVDELRDMERDTQHLLSNVEVFQQTMRDGAN